jgi:transcriptional regulator
MYIKDEYAIHDLDAAASIVRANPFATLVTSALRATHMPCLVDEGEAEPLTIVGHVARADPVAELLNGPLLAIFQGPQGYISASWYAAELIPTWNHLTLHIGGRPELLDDPMPVLCRTVDHFEAAVERPWSLDRAGETAGQMAAQVVAFKLQAEWWHVEAKLSQDKPADERARVLAELEGDSAYANHLLAEVMRRFGA